MILRRFFTLSLVTKQSFPTLHSRSFFAKKQQQEVEQPTNTQEHSEEVVATEQVPPTQQLKQTPPQKYKRFDKPRRFRPVQNQYVVTQFLHMKQDHSKIDQAINELKDITDKEQLFAKFQKLEALLQNEKNTPLREYEKKLNIWPENLIKSESSLLRTTENPKKQMRLVQRILNMEQDQLKRFYENRGQQLEKLQLVEFPFQVIKTVDENKPKNFLLNLLYQYSNNRQDMGNTQVKQDSFQRCLQAVFTGQYREVNPLKFYWFCTRINKQLLFQISSYVLKQFCKLQINGKRLDKQIRSLQSFYFDKKVSQALVNRIFLKATSLTEAIRLWVLTLVIFSRIKSLQSVYKQQKKVNFNDILNESQNGGYFSEYFLLDLPQVLFDKASVSQYQTYRKALKHHSQKSKNIIELSVGPFETLLNLSLTQKNNLMDIQYLFEADPRPIKVSYSKTITSAIKTNRNEINLVQNIIEGKYESALQYFIEKIARPQDLQALYKYRIQGQNLFRDKSSQALYVLKEMFRDSKYILDEENFKLTTRTVSSSFRETKNFEDTYSQRKKFISPNEEIRNQLKEAKQQRQKQQNLEVQKLPGIKAKKGLFTRKPAASFSTSKDIDPEQQKKSDEQYENYLRTIKQIQSAIATQETKKPPQEVKKVSLFDFSSCIGLQDVQKEFQKHFNEINKDNLEALLASKEYVPLIGELRILIKHYFLSSKSGGENQPIQGLTSEFASSFGQISKDYNQYLKNCSMMFEFPDEFYEDLLSDQEKKNNRHQFKRIVAHILLFKKKLSTSIVTKICDICSKQKIGLTLLQIINLINTRQCILTYESLKKVASSIQNFKNMQSDLISFVRNYCDRTGTQIETQLFQPYISNLTFTQRYETLNTFLEILRQQFKPKQYKINPKLSAQQNIKAERAYKQKQQQRLNKQLFEMIQIVSTSLKPRTTIPSFIPQLFDIYITKKKGKMTSAEYGVGLIVTSQNQDKFLELLAKLKAETSGENNVAVFQSLIKCLLVFGRNLKDHVDKILSATLYLKKHSLNELQMKNLGYIFSQLDVPGAFTQYLEYVLKTQPANNQEIKNLYYKVFNRTTDDHSKNQISGLLDFIFNPAKEKDRVQYKKVKIEEQRKAEILKEITSKKQQKKVDEVQPVQVKQVDKEKKKSKKQEKEEKKKLKQQKKQKKELQKQDKQQKQSAIVQIQTAASKNLKRIQKQQQKINTSFLYDQNKKLIYSQKLSKRDLRKQSLVMFVENYLRKFENKPDEQQAGKDKKGKGKQTKQTSKSAPKSASKEAKKK